ncbi:flagellar basal-body MS-ring/collar protein FliF [Zavarzinia compransoris]|uniref:Flagellar M-ring protein n=1 Tax=Zavarzinia compransoris TaxID=1264899 RepID=A0A317E458_9PROT|nr:flagellar basal-body MS-ring/collar protein FliF [Zavarzinia compransoris]PWR21827.1 flagellar M-ring protein FliF [Zavarzinia compransoris]TDP45373.1 flagellar M-ring protein FliF [Zavarzinia compransoris]
MNELLTRLRALGLRRLLALGGVTVAVVAFLAFAANRMTAPSYALLYGDLALADSGQIVQKLEELKVPYQLSADGTRIMVPEDQVARLRMTMAESGMPAGGSMGYEIFDRGDAIGTTSFVQNINHLRALEGEIARSIGSIDRIAAARVHLVLPQRQLFARETEPPSASIVLKLRSGSLDGAQVRAIQQLTAAAVPGLKPERVSIVDDRGNLLAAGNGDALAADPAQAAATKTREYEARLRRSLEQLIASSVGADKVRAEVTAELDYDRVTTQTETYDPDGQVVRSTQTVTDRSRNTEGGNGPVTVQGNLPGGQNQGGGAGQSSSADRSEETTNYEISRTQQTTMQEGGRVKRISVAILVDGTYQAQADGSRSYQPRSQQELEQLETLVKSAIGFDQQRGDQVRVVNLPFVDTSLPADGGTGDAGFLGMTKADYFKIGEIAILGLVALLLTLFVIRPLVARLLGPVPGATPALAGAGALAGMPGAMPGQAALPGPDGRPMLAGPAGAATAEDEFEQMVDIANIEGRVKASSLKKVGEIVQRHPEEAIAIMRNWMYREQ